ncbi:scavenger receptor cysteine-rich type 1 protein M160 [Misgurnus anguillicaudatus]|uniref:scavenger receptor cysteine-rich type 1 protein M160 n=1 Tax=Misgurnus anguillicaudatus TaxID=75329 RepID=UPI003CCF930D
MPVQNGQDRVVLRGSNSPCKGRLEVYRTQEKKQKQEEKWGLVCPYGWNDINGEVVCKSLECGELLKTDKEMSLYKDPSLPKQFFMDQVKCSPNEKNLKSCSYVGGTTIDCKENGFVAVECSGNVKLSLNMNGQTDKCAGVVQFTTQNGVVIGVCNSQWDKYHRRFRLKGGSNLCSGSVEELIEKKWVQKTPNNINLDTICAQLNCGSRKNITDVMKTNGTHLTCSGNVSLSKLTGCFGSVYVNVNGAEHGVCFNDFKSDKLGTVVCRELGCGELKDVKPGKWITNGWLSNIECQGDEESLWHCLAIRKKIACFGTTVICSASMKVRLSDGWGRCSGRVQVNLEGSWRYFNTNDWTDKNSDVVCNHLGCGDLFKTTQNQDLFIEVNPQLMMEDWEVKCPSSSKKFHECFEKRTKEQKQIQIKFDTKQIICQKEKFRFIKGDQPCQGEIGIERFGEEDSSDSKSLNNMTVCSEMNCGDLQLSGTNATHVNCSGSVNVSLSEGCWGDVKVEMMVVQNKCRDDGCGGICKKTWRTEESKMLCKDLGCGDPINNFQLKTQNPLQVKHYSVYCPKQVNNLKMCKFTPNKAICKEPASVVCSGSVKSRLFSPLKIPRDKCAGNVQLYYAGIWRPVCKDSLNQNLQNIICKELSCGEGKSVDTARFEEGKTKGLTGIKCLTGAKSLFECKHDDVSTKDCSAGYLKCSEWTRLLLYKNDGPCSGPVYAVSEHPTPHHVNIQNWTEDDGQLMCEYLQCGNYISHNQTTVFPTSEWWNKTYNCTGNKKNIWDCESDSQSFHPKQLNITCDAKLLNLSLSKSCTGEVRINKKPVCASEWTEKMSDVVCDKLQCGRAIRHWQKPISTESEGWHFSCSGNETFLQQCSHIQGRCANIIYVACKSEKGVRFSTTKKCGGFLGINYQDQWEYVCGDLKKPVDNVEVCKELDCQKNLAPLIEREKMDSKKHVTIQCPDKYQHLSQCLTHLQEDNCKPVEIKCEGFEESTPVNIGLVVGLLLGFLGLLVLIGITQRKRLLSAFFSVRRYRSKDVKNMNFNGHEMNNTETVDEDSTERKFDQDDYQDVDIAITNTEREHDVDDKSARSSGTEYDDIEEQANDASYPQTPADEDQTLPLLPSRPENLHDEVTYEVEKEIQEDYDDVMSEEALANENAEISMKDAPAQADVIMDEGGNANTNEVEVEVHSQPE